MANARSGGSAKSLSYFQGPRVLCGTRVRLEAISANVAREPIVYEHCHGRIERRLLADSTFTFPCVINDSVNDRAKNHGREAKFRPETTKPFDESISLLRSRIITKYPCDPNEITADRIQRRTLLGVETTTGMASRFPKIRIYPNLANRTYLSRTSNLNQACRSREPTSAAKMSSQSQSRRGLVSTHRIYPA